MKRVNELKEGIDLAASSSGGELIQGLSQTFKTLEKSGEAVKPLQFIQIFMAVFPQFSERVESGAFQQQDADECFQLMLASFEPYLSDGTTSLIDKLFAFDLKFEMRNTEAEEGAEDPVFSHEKMRKLACVIDNQANPINLLTEGIQAVIFVLLRDLQKKLKKILLV